MLIFGFFFLLFFFSFHFVLGAGEVSLELAGATAHGPLLVTPQTLQAKEKKGTFGREGSKEGGKVSIRKQVSAGVYEEGG